MQQSDLICFSLFLQAYEEAQKRLKMAEDDKNNMVAALTTMFKLVDLKRVAKCALVLKVARVEEKVSSVVFKEEGS